MEYINHIHVPNTISSNDQICNHGQNSLNETHQQPSMERNIQNAHYDPNDPEKSLPNVVIMNNGPDSSSNKCDGNNHEFHDTDYAKVPCEDVGNKLIQTNHIQQIINENEMTNPNLENLQNGCSAQPLEMKREFENGCSAQSLEMKREFENGCSAQPVEIKREFENDNETPNNNLTQQPPKKRRKISYHVQRRRWTEAEKSLVQNAFGFHIPLGTLPKGVECRELIKNHLDVLGHRTPAQIKTWLHNQIRNATKH